MVVGSLTSLVLRGVHQLCDSWLERAVVASRPHLQELVIDDCPAVTLSRGVLKGLQQSSASLSRLTLKHLPKITYIGQIDLLRRKRSLLLNALAHLELDGCGALAAIKLSAPRLEVWQIRPIASGGNIPWPLFLTCASNFP